MPFQTCGYNGCQNPVASDAVRCWRHVDSGVEAVVPNADPAAVEQARALLSEFQGGAALAPPPGGLEGPSAVASIFVDYTDVRPDAAVAAVVASAMLRHEYGDTSTPDGATNALHHGGLERFQQHLQQNGVAPGRISTLRLVGFHRRLPSGREQYGDDITHEVTVLDADTDQEVVVEPFMASFAPIKNRTLQVDDQLDSGSTPFGDAPWIGSKDGYVNGDHLWWDRSEYVTPR